MLKLHRKIEQKHFKGKHLNQFDDILSLIGTK